jgi:hypothetical protein
MISLEKWGLLNRVVETVWGTTSSHSGQYQIAVTLIESELNHDSLEKKHSQPRIGPQTCPASC